MGISRGDESGKSGDSESSEKSEEPALCITSDEVNYLVFRYVFGSEALKGLCFRLVSNLCPSIHSYCILDICKKAGSFILPLPLSMRVCWGEPI